MNVMMEAVFASRVKHNDFWKFDAKQAREFRTLLMVLL
jgi:hypothetical protein